MIVSGKTSITQAAWDVRRPLLLVALVSVCVVGAYVPLEKRWVSINITVLTSLGVALSVFLSFRNNVVYQRYWEARGLWGRLINASRTLLRQTATFVHDETERAQLLETLGRFLIAFAYAFRAHLRGDNAKHEASRFLQDSELPALDRNVPAALLHQMGQALRLAAQAGHLSDISLLRMDETLTEITDVLGGCERIKNTPLPPAYTYLAHKIVLAYCCLVPFGLVGELHYLTPVLSVVVAFAFVTLDHISELIEQPFALDPNDLPLSALSRTIENDVRERLNESPLPIVEPEAGILL